MTKHVVLDAMLTLVAGLHPSDVLLRVVRAACLLVDARYGALVTTGPNRRSVAHSRDDADLEAAERFRNLAGDELYQLLGDEPVRCADLGSHLASLGYPQGEMHGRTFLGVPIRSRRGFSATIGLTEKRDGEEFTIEDQEALLAFAAVAGAVIDNAQLSHETRQRELWVALHGEIATALLAGLDVDKVLDLVARGARELTDADTSTVCLLEDDSSMTVSAADGLRADQLLGMSLPLEGSVSGAVVTTGVPAVLTDNSVEECACEPIASADGVGQVMVVPLLSNGWRNGTLAVARFGSERALDRTDAWLLESFASQVSVALEYGRARSELARLALLDDHDRIARDLHDNVIQQLFSTGMSLQGIAGRMADRHLADRVLQEVNLLDNTIRDIRSTVFALTSPADRPAGVRASILTEVARVAEPHDMNVRVDFEGPVDTAVGEITQPHVIATLREALTNVARHARAKRVFVRLEVGPDIVLQVSDDGVGIPPDQMRRSGLRNLSERAVFLGGRMELGTPETGGTVLTWRVPVDGPPER